MVKESIVIYDTKKEIELTSNGSRPIEIHVREFVCQLLNVVRFKSFAVLLYDLDNTRKKMKKIDQSSNVK